MCKLWGLKQSHAWNAIWVCSSLHMDLILSLLSRVQLSAIVTLIPGPPGHPFDTQYPLYFPFVQREAENFKLSHLSWQKKRNFIHYLTPVYFQGGFARVHELIDLKTNSVTAAKIIHKSRISKPHHKEKISREIELHRSLRHKNVVQFFKHFEDGDNIYIMLENCRHTNADAQTCTLTQAYISHMTLENNKHWADTMCVFKLLFRENLLSHNLHSNSLFAMILLINWKGVDVRKLIKSFEKAFNVFYISKYRVQCHCYKCKLVALLCHLTYLCTNVLRAADHKPRSYD